MPDAEMLLRTFQVNESSARQRSKCYILSSIYGTADGRFPSKDFNWQLANSRRHIMLLQHCLLDLRKSNRNAIDRSGIKSADPAVDGRSPTDLL